MIEAIAVEKKSLYAFIGLPEPIAVMLFTIALILMLAPYCAGVNLGVLVIPNFGEKIKRRLKFVGPLLFAFTLTGFSSIQTFVLAESIPPYIKNYDPTRFEVADENITVDTGLWERVNPNAVKEDRVSPAKWTIKTRVKKSKDAPSFFYKDIWTTGLKPDVSCSTHPISFMEIPYEPNSGRVKLNRYALLIDVSKESPNRDFEIQCTYIFWNGFQNETEEWAVAVVKHPTKKLTFSILSPRDKPFTGYNLYSYSTSDSPGLERFTENPNFEFSREKMVWKIDNPEVGRSYRTNWQW